MFKKTTFLSLALLAANHLSADIYKDEKHKEYRTVQVEVKKIDATKWNIFKNSLNSIKYDLSAILIFFAHQFFLNYQLSRLLPLEDFDTKFLENPHLMFFNLLKFSGYCIASSILMGISFRYLVSKIWTNEKLTYKLIKKWWNKEESIELLVYPENHIINI